MKTTVLAALVVAALPNCALAQALSADPSAACDVAVWTGSRYQADRIGLVTGGLIDQMLRRSEVPEINSEEAIRSMLPASALFETVATSRLEEILGRDVNYVHVDKSRDESRADRGRKARSTASTNACYIEIYIDFVYYQSAPFHGERIFSSYTFRDFRGTKLAKSGGYDNGQMERFSAQDVPTATTMARRAVQEVFERIAEKRFAPRIRARRG